MSAAGERGASATIKRLDKLAPSAQDVATTRNIIDKAVMPLAEKQELKESLDSVQKMKVGCPDGFALLPLAFLSCCLHALCYVLRDANGS